MVSENDGDQIILHDVTPYTSSGLPQTILTHYPESSGTLEEFVFEYE